MVFYMSFFEAVEHLPPEDFKDTLCGIFNYALCGKMPECDGVAKSIFVLTKPQIDKNNQRYENAKKSHAPKPEKPCSEDKNTHTEKESKSLNTSENKPSEKAQNRVENTEKQADIKAENKAETVIEKPENTPKTPPEADFSPYSEPCESLDFIPDSDLIISSDSFAQSKNSDAVTPVTDGYGVYNNVVLSPLEKSKLIVELGMTKYLDRVEFLSRYIKRKPGYKSACHYEDIRGWVNDAVTKQRPPKKEEKPNPFGDLQFEDFFEKP